MVKQKTCHLPFLQALAVCPQKLQTRWAQKPAKEKPTTPGNRPTTPCKPLYTQKYTTPPLPLIKQVNKSYHAEVTEKYHYRRPLGFLPHHSLSLYPCTLACWSRIRYLFSTTPARLLRAVDKPSRLLASWQNRTGSSFLECFPSFTTESHWFLDSFLSSPRNCCLLLSPSFITGSWNPVCCCLPRFTDSTSVCVAPGSAANYC